MLEIRFTEADLAGIDASFGRLEGAFADLSIGPMRSGLADAGMEYLQFVQDRFAHEGDGDWEELAGKTRRQRKWLGFPPAHPILHRLGILYRSLVPGEAGNVFEIDKDGAFVGIGGTDMHPGYITPTGKTIGGDLTIGEIARFHQTGTDKMPARPIIVFPDQPTIARIFAALKAAAAKTLAQFRQKAA